MSRFQSGFAPKANVEDPMPPEVAHALLEYRRDLRPAQWETLMRAYTKARQSYASVFALTIAEQATFKRQASGSKA